MEPGETPLDTAIREFFEETKLTKDSYTLETDPLFHGRTVKNGGA
jgi:8-oxo-dGTP pyrophosphatase MutT (NUDIX family)